MAGKEKLMVQHMKRHDRRCPECGGPLIPSPKVMIGTILYCTGKGSDPKCKAKFFDNQGKLIPRG